MIWKHTLSTLSTCFLDKLRHSNGVRKTSRFVLSLKDWWRYSTRNSTTSNTLVPNPHGCCKHLYNQTSEVGTSQQTRHPNDGCVAAPWRRHCFNMFHMRHIMFYHVSIMLLSLFQQHVSIHVSIMSNFKWIDGTSWNLLYRKAMIHLLNTTARCWLYLYFSYAVKYYGIR